MDENDIKFNEKDLQNLEQAQQSVSEVVPSPSTSFFPQMAPQQTKQVVPIVQPVAAAQPAAQNMEALLQRGLITPQQAEALKTLVPPPMPQQVQPLPAQIAPQPQVVVQPQVDAAKTEQVAREAAAAELQRKEQEAMAQQQVMEQEAQKQLQAQQQEAAEKERATIALAQQKKQQLAQQELENRQRMEQETARLKQQEDEMREEEYTRQDGLFNPQDSIGKRFMQGIGIMLGGLAQGMGAKSNVALDILMKNLDRRIEDRKLNQEKALTLKKIAVDEVQNKIKQQMANTDSLLARANYMKLLSELNSAGQGLTDKMQIYAKARHGGLTGEEIDMLDEKDRARVLTLPNGKFALAANESAANKIRESLADNASASESLRAINDLADYFGNNPIKKTLSFDKIAQAKSLQQALVGKMRLELFGPGVLTDYEQEIARGIIRRPDSIFSLASSNKAAYDVLRKKLNFSKNELLRNAGISVPRSSNELLLEEARKKNPGIPDSKLITLLIKKGVWKDE